MKNKKKANYLHRLSIKAMQIGIMAFLALNCLPALAQQSDIRVRGVVTSDTDGLPIIGVSVAQKGSSNGIQTNLNGSYELSVPIGSVLEFTYLGFIKEEVKVVAGTTTYNIILKEDLLALDEVVVVGYSVQKKSVVTGAISRVTNKELDLEKPTNVQNALKGKVSGVQITSNSGQPGQDSKIYIRGIGTVNDSGPLYIIDGMPSSNGINFLNPSDIASIEILKDAASAAIYGARGANGVVLVTTKGGTKNSKATVSYEFSYGLQNPSQTTNQLGSADYQMLMNEMGKNSNRGDKYFFPTPSTVDTDWQDVLTYNNSPLINHKVSIAGGGERNTYYASFGLVDQSGIFAKGYSEFKRINGRLNVTQTLLDTQERSWLNNIVLGGNFSYSRTKRDGSTIGNSEASGIITSILHLPPTEKVYQDDPAQIDYYNRVYPNHMVAKDGRVYNIINMREIVKPLAALDARNNNLSEPQIFNANLDLTFTLLPGLTYKTTGDFELGIRSDRSFAPAYDLNTDQKAANATVYNNMYEQQKWQWENIINYKTSINKHNIGVLLGNTLASYFAHSINGRRYDPLQLNMDKAFLDISSNSPGYSLDRVNSSASDDKLVSFFGRLSYNYDEKYLLEATVRRDGSSNFGKNNQFATFPSVSAGWVFTQENFLENRPEWLSFGKIRASWGQNGNASIGSFGYTTLISKGDYRAVIDDQLLQGAKPNGYSNPNLKWETSEQLDLGLDLRLFNNLGITIDYFDKKTKDMLARVQLPDYAGYSSILTNVGTVSNKGWEFDASYKFNIHDVHFGVIANASYVKNVVTNQGDSDIPVAINGLGGGLGGAVTWRANGEPYGFFYGYVHDGIFQNAAEVAASKQANAVVGGIRWKDTDGVPGISGDDRQNIGKPNPDWTYGLTLNADYKGFDISAFFQGVYGNEIYKLYRRSNVPFANWDKAWLGRWTGEGTSNKYPILFEGGYGPGGTDSGANSVSDLFVEDGAYLRLKVLQLGYTLPAALTQKALVNRLRIYVQGENLFTVTNYTGLDPEVGTRNGFDGGTYPQARILTIGANLTF
jgi:TonB-linked SusC/RagA family outer membrane protein